MMLSWGSLSNRVEDEKGSVHRVAAMSPREMTKVLHEAVARGDLDAVHTLLKEGAQLDKRNEAAHPVLYTAVRYRQWAMIVFLLEAGAEPFYHVPSLPPTVLHHLISLETVPWALLPWVCSPIPAESLYAVLLTSDKEGYTVSDRARARLHAEPLGQRTEGLQALRLLRSQSMEVFFHRKEKEAEGLKKDEAKEALQEEEDTDKIKNNLLDQQDRVDEYVLKINFSSLSQLYQQEVGTGKKEKKEIGWETIIQWIQRQGYAKVAATISVDSPAVIPLLLSWSDAFLVTKNFNEAMHYASTALSCASQVGVFSKALPAVLQKIQHILIACTVQFSDKPPPFYSDVLACRRLLHYHRAALSGKYQIVILGYPSEVLLKTPSLFQPGTLIVSPSEVSEEVSVLWSDGCGVLTRYFSFAMAPLQALRPFIEQAKEQPVILNNQDLPAVVNPIVQLCTPFFGTPLPTFPCHDDNQLFHWLSVNTSFFKTLTQRLWEEALYLRTGPLPCHHALIGLGSMAREEMCPYSDIECAVLLESDLPENQAYFKQVATLFQLLFFSLGETPLDKVKFAAGLQLPIPKGFHLDAAYHPLQPGMMGSVKTLMAIQKDPAADPLQRQALRNVTIIHEDVPGLGKNYQTQLEDWLSSPHSERPAWQLLRRRLDPPSRKSLALRSMGTLLENSKPTEMYRRKPADPINLKQELCTFPIQAISNLCLYYGLQARTTKEGIKKLFEEKQMGSLGVRHLRNLVSGALHLRALTHFHQREEGDFIYAATRYAAWLPQIILTLSQEETIALHQLYCVLLPFEEEMGRWVESKGSRNLQPVSFYATTDLLKAKAYDRYDGDQGQEACQMHDLLLHRSSHVPSVCAAWLQFYYSQYEIVCQERRLLEQEMHVLGQHVAQTLLKEQLPVAGYLVSYQMLSSHGRMGFKKAIEEKPSPYRTAILETLKQVERSSTQGSVEQASLQETPEEKEWWAQQIIKADRLVEFKGSPKALSHQNANKEEKMQQLALHEQQARFKEYNRRRRTKLTAADTEVLHRGCARTLFYSIQLLEGQAQRTFRKVNQKLKEFITLWKEKGFPKDYYMKVYTALPTDLRKCFRQAILHYLDLETARLKEEERCFFESVLSEFNTYPDEDGQRAEWVKHKARWQETLYALIQKETVSYNADQKSVSLLPRITSPLLLQKHIRLEGLRKIKEGEEELPFFILKPDICVQIIDEEKKDFKHNRIKGSQHDIVLVKLLPPCGLKEKNKASRGVYIKKNPELSGMTYLIEVAHHQIIGHGTSLSELVRLDIGERRFQQSLPVLVSEEIVGENFDDILLHHPEQLSKLSHRHYCELTLLAMLINPGDGKPANYIWVPLENGEYTLVSIDHDHALFPPYLPKEMKEAKESKESKESNGAKKPESSQELELQVRSILFCLDKMNEPVDIEVAKNFSERMEPFKMLRSILQQAQVQNEYYAQLFDKAQIKTLNKRGQSTIPIPIKEGDILTLYQKLCRLQQFLKHCPQASLLQCLFQVEPRVGLAYAHSLKQSLNPRERLQQVGNYPVDHQGNLLTSRSALMSRKIGSGRVGLQTDYLKLEVFNPGKGLYELERLAYQRQRLLAIQEEVQGGKFHHFSTLLSSIDQEIILCGDWRKEEEGLSKGIRPLNWKGLNPAQQSNLLDILIKRPLQRLQLSHCDALTPEYVVQLLEVSPELRELYIEGYRGETINELPQVLKAYPTLQVLYLRGSKRLRRIEELSLPALELLVVEECPALEVLRLDMPRLRTLRARDCPCLTVVQTGSHSLEQMDLNGAMQLLPEGLKQATANWYILKKLMLDDCSSLGIWVELAQYPFLLALLACDPEESILKKIQKIFYELEEKITLLTIIELEKLVTGILLFTQLQAPSFINKSLRELSQRLMWSDEQENIDNRQLAIEALNNMAQIIRPENNEGLLKRILKNLRPELEGRSSDPGENAVKALRKIVGSKIELADDLLKDLKADLTLSLNRKRAVTALGKIAIAIPELANSILSELKSLQHDEDKEVRQNAIEAVSTIAKVNHLEDQKTTSAQKAIGALARINQLEPEFITEDFIREWKKHLEDGDKEVRHEAICVLGDIAKARPGFAGRILNDLRPLLNNLDDQEESMVLAIGIIKKIVSFTPSLTFNAFLLLKHFIADTYTTYFSVRIAAIEVCMTISAAFDIFHAPDLSAYVYLFLKRLKEPFHSGTQAFDPAVFQYTTAWITKTLSAVEENGLSKDIERPIMPSHLPIRSSTPKFNSKYYEDSKDQREGKRYECDERDADDQQQYTLMHFPGSRTRSRRDHDFFLSPSAQPSLSIPGSMTSIPLSSSSSSASSSQIASSSLSSSSGSEPAPCPPYSSSSSSSSSLSSSSLFAPIGAISASSTSSSSVSSASPSLSSSNSRV